MGDDKQITDYNGEGKPLDEKVSKDGDMDAVVTKWENEWTAKKSEEQRKNAARRR